MELPRQRPFGTEARKPTHHDFLSLYSHSTVQQDPIPPCQGGYLKTHDFLQPLEQREGKTTAKEETNVEIPTSEKPPPPAPPPPPPPSGEHILPGGFGTYSINHISYINQRVPKAEGNVIFTAAKASGTERNEENSNCSSYTDSGFTLRAESALKKGKTGKENVKERHNSTGREATSKAGQWAMSERRSQSSSNNHRNSFSSLSSSQPSEQKSQSFMEMIKSAKGSTQDEDLDDEEEFFLKKESTSPIRKGELRVNVDEKSTDQKANTPRSKHSATEQRRRSKINYRFQVLRELIPHGNQKRDKASFLLEVIEYIQFLQEKVEKYEGSYQGWNQEQAKFMPWGNTTRQAESYVNQTRAINSGPHPALPFDSKFDEKNITILPAIAGSAQNPVESDMSSASNIKAMDNHPGMKKKTIPFPVSLQPNFFNTARNGSAVAQPAPRLASDVDNATIQSPPQSGHARSCSIDDAAAKDKSKEQELQIEGGTISISTVYSQGLLNTLTQALQSSGVNLSQASISVQIELGKRTNGRTVSPTSHKDVEVPSRNHGTTRPRVSIGEESDQALKKLKTSKS